MKTFGEALSAYKRPVKDLLDLFAGPNADEHTRSQVQGRLDDARKIDLAKATIVIASWENRFAAAGGVRAVTQEYARHLVSRGRATRVVTPLHLGLKTAPGNLGLPVAVLWVNFQKTNHRVEVYESEWEGVAWIYIHSAGFFLAEGGRDGTNPYLFQHDADEERAGRGSPRLTRDCLFYAAALPRVLAALNMTDNLVLHLQDWETAGAALTVKEAILRKEISRAVCVLALHNPYDKGLNPPSLTSDGWPLLTERVEPTTGPSTFLNRMLPLLDAPPATVSREFAVDLMSDPLQTRHLADHLQDHFRRFGIEGVDNGPFETRDSPFSESAVSGARSGKPHMILAEKQMLRDAMKKVMADYRPEKSYGNVDFANLADRVPVFMCVGRLDPGQKGFDVAARAIERLLEGGLDARFVLTPIVGDAPQPFVDDLESLARRFPDQVVVYPIRMAKGYAETQAGCTFSLWPSMYEPFGAVSEFLLRGTPVIARSTGGLRQQVTDFDPKTGAGNGILYKTDDPADDVYMRDLPADHPDKNKNEWKVMQEKDNPGDRMEFPVYIDQINKLSAAVTEAVAIFDDPNAYGRLLANTYDSVAGYSWEGAENEYGALYETATRP